MKITGSSNPIHIPFLSIAAVSFIVGILCVFSINIPFVITYALAICLLLLLIYLYRKGKRIDFLIIMVFFLVGMIHQSNSATLQSNDIYFFTGSQNNRVSVQGVVASHIQEGPFDKSFVFYPHRIQLAEYDGIVRGKLYVRFNKRVDIQYGNHLRIEGTLKALNDSGYFNRRLIRQGIRSVLYVGWRDWIDKTHLGNFSIQRLAFAAKEKLKAHFAKIPSPTRDFLVAFILGDRAGLSPELYSVFRYTGTVHILAISGLHVGIIIFIFLVFLKVLRIKRKPRFIITICFLLLYCFITGLRASVVRAVIMAIILLMSYIVEREYHIYNSLALAAMIILWIWPWQIFDIGFQLSFVSVLSIVFLYPKIIVHLPKQKNRFFAFMRTSFVVSCSAWLGATPLVAYYFGIVSLISVIANVLLVMFMPFIIAGGFIYLIMSYLLPFLTIWIARSLEYMIYCILLLTIYLKEIPFAYFYVERFSTYIIFVYYGFIIMFFNRHLLQRRGIYTEE